MDLRSSLSQEQCLTQEGHLSLHSVTNHSSLPTNSGEGEIDLPSQLLASLREREVTCLLLPGGAWELRGNDYGLDGTVGPGPLLAPNGLPPTHTHTHLKSGLMDNVIIAFLGQEKQEARLRLGAEHGDLRGV